MYDPNLLIELSDEQMLLLLSKESSNILGYRSKHESIKMKNLHEKLSKWGVNGILSKSYNLQRNDYLNNRPNKIKQLIRRKV